MSDDKLLLPREIQERGRFSRWTLARLIRAGELRVVRHGNIVRIRQSDWEDFLSRHTEGKK
jgi:excisionase family DNA binding protein